MNPDAPEPSDDLPAVRKPRPFAGWGTATARVLSAAATALIAVTGRAFGEVQKRGTTAYGEFQARPEHARYRAYAFGSYGLIVVATLLAQLYTSNPLHSYVRVLRVDLPSTTEVFIRNDSPRAWKHVKVTLNGIFGYETNAVQPGAHVQLRVDRFALFDGSGHPSYAPKNIQLKQLSIDCDEGHSDTELSP